MNEIAMLIGYVVIFSFALLIVLYLAYLSLLIFCKSARYLHSKLRLLFWYA